MNAQALRNMDRGRGYHVDEEMARKETHREKRINLPTMAWKVGVSTTGLLLLLAAMGKADAAEAISADMSWSDGMMMGVSTRWEAVTGPGRRPVVVIAAGTGVG